MKVIFLDVDGVLNQSRPIGDDYEFYLPNWVLPKAMEHLNIIIEQTGAKVVVSSTWRIGKKVVELREMFAEAGLKGDIIDKTDQLGCAAHDPLPCHAAHRGSEIADWLRQREEDRGDVESFIILDDDSDMHPHKDRHVHTDLYRGLTRRKRDEAIKMLGRNKTA